MADTGNPLLIVISAPSGSGKTTLVNRLLEVIPGVERSVSYTTRPPRDGESDKRDYIFVSEDAFKEKIETNKFLEWEETFGYYYGTSKEQVIEALQKGDDIILSIDVKGARTVKEHFPECISVFIMPPSEQELEERLRKRSTDNSKQVSMRLEEAGKEIAASDEYDYLIINKEIEEAVTELKTIIETEKKNRKMMSEKGGNNGKECTAELDK